MSLTNNFGMQSETLSGITAKFQAADYTQAGEVNFEGMHLGADAGLNPTVDLGSTPTTLGM